MHRIAAVLELGLRVLSVGGNISTGDRPELQREAIHCM